MLVTVKISKGFKTWTEMAKSFEDEVGEKGAKIVWAAANPELVRDLMNNRRIEKENRTKVSKAVLDAKKVEERAEFKAFLDDPERYNGDARVVQQGIDQLFASGHTAEDLAPFLVYLDQSVQGRADGDYWREHINELALNNTLSVSYTHLTLPTNREV